MDSNEGMEALKVGKKVHEILIGNNNMILNTRFVVLIMKIPYKNYVIKYQTTV